ncbi:nuclear pore complex protein NUP1 isoform X3 [Trifolium pratense]|uniref:nuclear pore complex protein NUP1 isoform X3 n=1 Tax=Trifolium pratense TaxID=57577 RepID=UPI001E693433|nr:nuclear pore complex protein NUP1 isoform X3 [Trifolium pratense]
MATAREENGYEGGGGFGKFRKRPFRRTQTTPYDRPPTALRNPNHNNGWLSKLLDPAQRLITYSAHRLFASVFRKRLPPPPSETVQEARDNRKETSTFVANESSGKQQRVRGESSDQINLSAEVGLPELEKMLTHQTFTRSEIDHLVELMHSRSVDTAAREEGKRTEVVPLESVLPRNQKEEYPQTPALENGIENHVVSTPHSTFSISVEGVASPAQLGKAYMESRPSQVSPLMVGSRSPTGEDSILLKGHHFVQKSPVMSIVPRATNHARVSENGFLTPRSRGRSAIYNMAATPYPRVYPASRLKGAGIHVEDGPSSSTQHALDHGVLSGTKQGGLKRRSSVLGNDIGSLGPIRRIRHKANLLSSKGLTLTHSDSPLPITSSGVGIINAAQQSSLSMQKPILSGEVKHSHSKSSAENEDDTMPSSSFPPLPSKSSEMASKILQQLDKMVSPKEKSSILRMPNVNDKSPTKLSSSMLRGQALRSMETVDSSKLLDSVQDNELDDTLRSLSASAQKLTSKRSKMENGLKPVSLNNGLIPAVTGSDSTVPRNQVMSIGKSEVSSDPPSKKRAFCMSAHEDFLELDDDDDDACPNGAASPFSTSRKDTKGSTAVAEKTASAIEKPVQETPPGSSVVMSSKSFTADGKLRTHDSLIVDEKVDAPTSITSSIAAGPTVNSNMGAVKTSKHTNLSSDKPTSPNGSVADPPLFNFGNNFVPSTELTGADDQPKESTKTGPVFGLDNAAPSKETSATDAPSVNFGFNKNNDSVPLVPFTSSSSVGGDSTFFKFGGAPDSKLCSTSSAAGNVDSVPKVHESDNADAKTNRVSGFPAPSSEPSSASTSLLTSPTNIFTFGNSSSSSNGSAAPSPVFSSPFLPVVTNNSTSQNMFSSSSLATSSSISAAVTSIPSMTTSTSAPVMVSSSSTTSLFTFGSTPSPSTSLPLSSSTEPVETKGEQNTGIGNLGTTSFGSSSAAVGSTGNSIFGFSSSATSANSQSQTQGSIFGTISGSSVGTLAPSATSGFATSTQSQSVAFGSSTSSPLVELTGNTAFSSGTPSLPCSSPATNIFNSGTISGQSTAASSLEANPVNSNSGTNSTSFGLPSWQPSKSSLFGTPFSSSSSSSSTSGVSFGTSTPSTSTSSPMVFGSSTGASVPPFSFNSAAATTNTQPAFGNPSPVFAFGTASVNNDQTSMEDSMAEDTVQATPSVTPVFGQQPPPVQSNFVFGAPTPPAANPFQFGGQQNIAPQNPSPFLASGSLEFNAGGSFSLGTGGVDKSGRKHIKIKHNRQRKK